MMPVGHPSIPSHPQGHAVGQQGVPMMQHGMLPSQQMQMGMNQLGTPMHRPMPSGAQMPPQSLIYPGHNVWRPEVMPAGMTPGLMPGVGPGMTTARMPNAYGAFPIAPPSYTPEMRKRFTEKQGQYAQHQHANSHQWQQQQQLAIQKQQQQQQQLMKRRQREEQQRKFKQFSANGGKHMSADSLIESMIGKPSTSSTAKQTTTQSIELPAEELENSFGDFMTGPVQEKPVPTATAMTTAVPNVETAINETGTEVNEIQNEDSVLAMMMQCSDLSAPSKANRFNKKPSVRDMPRASSANHVEYQSSEKARRWDSSNETLSQLFTLPAPVHAPPPHPAAPPGGGGVTSQHDKSVKEFVMPAWCDPDGTVPIVYTHVLEAVTRDGKIDTNQVYPILLRSGLPREALGHIWGMCNRKIPGELIREELFLILAMIALAQNNQDISSLSILRRCPQAPVPYLGQPTPSHPTVAAVNSSTPSASPVPAADSVTSHAVGANGTSMGSAVIVTEPDRTSTAEYDDDDDFHEWKSAPSVAPTASPAPKSATPSAIPALERKSSLSSVSSLCTTSPAVLHPSSSLPSFASWTPALATAGLTPQATKHLSNMLPVSATVESSALKLPSATDSAKLNVAETSSPVHDEFGDFSSFSSNKPETAGSCEKPAELMGPEDMYAALRNVDDDDTSASWNTAVAWEGNNVDEQQEEFADFSQAFANEDTSTSNSEEQGTDNQHSVKSDSVKCVRPTLEDDFADFQSATASDDNIAKKYDCQTSSKDFLSLTSLVMDSSLYSATPNIAVDTQTLPEREEPITFDTDNKNTSDMWTTSDIEFPSAVSETLNALPTTTAASKPRSESPYKTSNKAANYFSRNLDVGTNLCPPVLDSLPPELPDADEDDYYGSGDDSFDTFGTFQSSDLHTGNADMSFSSLRVPYGGLAEFDVEQMSTYPESRYDQLPTPLSEFGGWTAGKTAVVKEDGQSINSLDLRPQYNGSSPPDSQSEASLDLPVSNGGGLKKVDSTMDTMSVASLELKKVSSEVGLAVAATEAADNLELEDAATYPAVDDIVQSPKEVIFDDIVQKPKDVSELLAESSMLAGDRYSQLSKEPQAIDRHMHHWQCCLDKCNEIIKQANDTCNSLSSASLCQQLANSQQGSAYFHGVVEIYKVACKITVAVKEASLAKDNLEKLMKDIEMAWMNLSAFISGLPVMPVASSLDFSAWSLNSTSDQTRACGVCLLDVDGGNGDDRQKLTFSGCQYHTSCANFWLNCVNCTLPALTRLQLI